jgi:phage terminase large subunit-like protein
MFTDLLARLGDMLQTDWPSQARKEQLPPPGDWSTWLILAGRSFGKTRAGAEWVRAQAEAATTSHIALIATTAAAARDVMIEGPAGLCSIAPNSFRPIFYPSKRSLEWPNGVKATLFASEEPDQLRGPQHSAAWLDELASFRNLEETWNNLQMGMRVGKHPRQVITTTPRPLKLLKQIMASPSTVTTRGSTYDNRRNLPASYFTDMIKKYEGTRIGRQELEAEILDDTPGALFTRDLIENARLPAEFLGVYKRIVVAIDPAVSVGEDSDETGIVVAATDDRDHAYVLEDLSGRYQPQKWAEIAISAYRRWSADRVVAEINNGGLMVENTLRQVDRNVSYRAVHASRGKQARAEPISALYEQSRVHHVGLFARLEDQMTAFVPGQSASGESPDRVDALVWALSELMVSTSRARALVFGSLGPPDELSHARRMLDTAHYHP